MSTYISLNQMQIQNANCVTGLTFGFPAITHFLGYVHALSRKLEKSHQITLDGCAISCHQHQIHAYQPKGFGEHIFSLTRNPLTSSGKVAPIIEEGKMHLTISLVIKCDGLIKGGEEGVIALQKHLENLCLMQKLAGGVINCIKKIDIESVSTDKEQQFTQRIRRRLLPGFLLLERSGFLEEHFAHLQAKNPEASILDAWLNFSALKFEASNEAQIDEDAIKKSSTPWSYIPKPNSGYLVPIAIGYKAISPVYKAGEIKGIRDPSIPFCFVESAYSIAEWQSAHRLQNIEDAFWHYHYEDGWYLCKNQKNIDTNVTEHEEDDFDSIFNEE